MSDREASVVVCNIFIAVVSALPKAFLKAVALVDEDWFEVAGAVHGLSVSLGAVGLVSAVVVLA